MLRSCTRSAVPARGNLPRYMSTTNETSFQDREKSMEDKHIRDHERRLLDDMSRQLKKKSNGAVGLADEVEKARNDVEDQILQLRKELLDEIREVKDLQAEQQFRLKRLESRNK